MLRIVKYVSAVLQILQKLIFFSGEFLYSQYIFLICNYEPEPISYKSSWE